MKDNNSQNKSIWRIVQGTINDHLIHLESNKGIKALFKQPRDQSSYKLVEIANELIVYQLALRLGIPVSETFVEYIEGRIGVISIIKSDLNWGTVSSPDEKNKVANMVLFKQLFVFDVWIANTDRAVSKKEHVIVIQNNNVYQFYAIDHGHTLNGCTRGEIKWQKDNVNDGTKFPTNNLNHISEPEINNLTDLELMIKKIEELQNGTIDNIIDSIYLLVSRDRPQEEQIALSTNCEIIRGLLKHRRDNLRTCIREWCIAKGKLADLN